MSEYFFVWVRGLRGPVAQKWHRDCLDLHSGPRAWNILSTRPLEDFEVDLPLDDLARRYAVPKD